jgi:hypothetical protein
MNTWLERWDRRYTERVQLLVDVLPALGSCPIAWCNSTARKS